VSAGGEGRRTPAARRAAAVGRSRAVAVALCASVLLAGLGLVGCGAGSTTPSSRTISGGTVTAPAATTVTATRTATTTAPASRSPAPASSPSPGSLPQTEQVPSASTPRFRALMAALWRGIVAGSTSTALPAFFPRGAYVQLKAIAEAGSDWQNRLVHDYALDIAAAHALLGPGASSAQLLGVHVVASYGHLVPAGTCYNSVPYYEMPNARVVYREGGAVRSFGIASMISWRGVWYVVHLGAVLRAGDEGVVDEPAAGEGVSAYSGTC
jgi:hypothetical protein